MEKKTPDDIKALLEESRKSLKEDKLTKDVDPLAVFTLADKLFVAYVSSGAINPETLLGEDARLVYSAMVTVAIDVETYKAKQLAAVMPLLPTRL
jgi:hypothetical protein